VRISNGEINQTIRTGDLIQVDGSAVVVRILERG
jgi:hypothetical protein